MMFVETYVHMVGLSVVVVILAITILNVDFKKR